jgi:hypothetical protein
MALHAEILAFMKYLAANPGLRSRIGAPPNATLLYAGDRPQNTPWKDPWKASTPVYRKLQTMKLTEPSLSQKKTLEDVIGTLPAPGTKFPSLLAYAEHVDQQVKKDGVGRAERNLIWRALSGIYASNARGAVSFLLGDGVSREALKIFALTEIPVLERNPYVDSITREMIAYFKTCVLTHKPNIRIGLIRNV